MEGCWSISSSFPDWETKPSATEIVQQNFPLGFDKIYQQHRGWWKQFWSASSISIPDKLLEKQWHLEQYKFASTARKQGPPISLQAIWTADNGRLPPWKGDFHHDLNTQLSYWPAYSGNHLDLEEGFVNWLWDHRETFRNYTKNYFATDGINVPGVTTLNGEPMGGWIQYSFGPTVSSWLAQHFYWHWRFSMDQEFLEEKAYPWIKEVGIYLEQLSTRRVNGKRQLPMSSSPEIHDNSREAWFEKTTNFDLALIHWTYEKAAELAMVLGKQEEAQKWQKLRSEWPELDVDPETGLTIGPGTPFTNSHRHFSHLVALHPLGLVDVSNGPEDRNIIQKSLSTLHHKGSDWWVGYSFSWQANLYARARLGNEAAEALRIFAANFCLPNSFHVNGDQSGKGFSKFTYRPFTLEGNFAFAAGLQEMLLQSHTNMIRVFPAIPDDWEEASFRNLRAQGAFLISAWREKGETVGVEVFSEKDSQFKMINPFSGPFKVSGNFHGDTRGDTIVLEIPRQERIILKLTELDD